MVNKAFLMLVTVFLFLPLGAWAADAPVISLEGRYWLPSLSADFKAGAGATDVNEDTLKIDNENFLDLRATWHINPSHSVRVSYIPVSYEGNAPIPAGGIGFGGKNYQTGRILTDLKMDYIRAGWLWNILKNEKVKFTALLDAKIFLIDAELKAPSQTLTHTQSFNLGVPTIGGVVEITPSKTVTISAEISGITAGSKGHIYDAEAGLKWMPFDNAALTGGYRVFEVRVKDSSDRGKVAMDGPFVGLIVSF